VATVSSPNNTIFIGFYQLSSACRLGGNLRERTVTNFLIGGSKDATTLQHSLIALTQLSHSPNPLILEGIGHVPSVECPALLADLLLKHLS
tara:strand:- start:728 stop:1000 length:273 start_codon:yes stop_codon:yes gene_type:complete